MDKFCLICKLCNNSMIGFPEWLSNKQSCPQCGGNYAEVLYSNLIEGLIKSFARPKKTSKGMWCYYDVLPLISEDNIISAGEGDVSIDRWTFLESFAQKYYGVKCKVYAHRQDNNNATGSFKDLSGSLVASVLLENNIRKYVVASTGNIGVAFARYISNYGGTLYAFIPSNSPKFKEAEIAIFGQKVFRVMGDYDKAKLLAEIFANEYNILEAGGTLDPMRVEAKKTMAFEWFKHMAEFPTVYIQALSGGTGFFGVEKGCRELIEAKLIKRMPRGILVQSDKCSPMADAWLSAKSKGFPDGWETSYPIYKNPKTEIITLATGKPSAYPILSKLVRESGGEIITFPEKLATDLTCIVAYETAVRIGPAAAIGVGGFFSSLKRKHIISNDIVLINIGEGIRRDPDFMIKLNKGTTKAMKIEDCLLFNRDKYKEELWSIFEENFAS